MHTVVSRDLPLRQREVRGEDISTYYNLFPPQPPMTAERELDLVRRMKAGDKEAERVLVLQYGGIGIAMALRFKQRSRHEGSDLDDLVGAALLGVVQGLTHYEEGRGSRVSTCIYFWVRAQLRRSKRSQRFITYSLAKEEILIKANRLKKEYFNANGKEMPTVLLAEELGISVEYFDKIVDEVSNTATYSVDSDGVRAPRSTHSGWTDDFIPLHQEDTPDHAATEEEFELMEESIQKDLEERESEVIRGRFLQGETLESLGKRLHLSRERIRQIEIKALAKLRKSLKEKLDL